MDRQMPWQGQWGFMALKAGHEYLPVLNEDLSLG